MDKRRVCVATAPPRAGHAHSPSCGSSAAAALTAKAAVAPRPTREFMSGAPRARAANPPDTMDRPGPAAVRNRPQATGSRAAGSGSGFLSGAGDSARRAGRGGALAVRCTRAGKQESHTLDRRGDGGNAPSRASADSAACTGVLVRVRSQAGAAAPSQWVTWCSRQAEASSQATPSRRVVSLQQPPILSQ